MLELARSAAASGADIEVLALNPRKHFVEDAVVCEGLDPIPASVVSADTSAIIRPLARSLVTREPFVVARFHSREMEAALRQRLRAHRHDVVIIESPFLTAYLPLIRRESDARVVLRAQNVEFRIWEALAANARGVRAAARALVARGVRVWELGTLNDFDGVLAITEADAKQFRNLGCRRPMHVLPCSVEMQPATETRPIDPRAIYFIGSMKYRPNLEAAAWIIDELWPRIRAMEPECRLTLAGLDFPQALATRAREVGIDVQRDVPDVRDFAAPFGVMIAPLLSGGGMRVKVLESLAMGKAVVATTIGAGGLDLTPGRDVLIEDDADAFAHAVVRCVRDPDFSCALGNAGRERVRELYDPLRLGAELLEFLEGLSSRA